jgi:Spy/CpxP family protein refolding chaperone
MKKLIVLVALFTTVYATNANAQQGQGGGDPAAMMQRMKERIKPLIIEKVKLTDEQADKVIEINMDVRKQMRDMRNENLSDDDRKAKVEALNVDRDKKYKAIPLTDEQVKGVNDFFDEMRKQQQQQRGQR